MVQQWVEGCTTTATTTATVACIVHTVLDMGVKHGVEQQEDGATWCLCKLQRTCEEAHCIHEDKEMQQEMRVLLFYCCTLYTLQFVVYVIVICNTVFASSCCLL